MDIFVKLGIDFTLFVQMALFLLAYAILYPLIFKPLFKAYKQRESLTLGNVDDKQQKLKLIEDLKNDYESKLKKLHMQIQGLFVDAKKEADDQALQKIQEAKKQADNLIAETRQKRALEHQAVKEQIQQKMPQLLEIAVKQILGKNTLGKSMKKRSEQ